MNEQPLESVPIRLIVGLGNPGKRYAGTRHNLGFLVLDAVAERLKAGRWREDRLADYTEVHVADTAIVLLKPMTFMNLSGHAVKAFCSRLKIAPQSLLVISDDLDLPFGRLRLRPGGSTGGHNGLKTVAAELETQSFPRLRIGIGRPAEGEPIEYVLSPFLTSEQADLPLIRARAADMVLAAIEAGLHTAMNQFNGKGDVLGPKAVADKQRPGLGTGSAGVPPVPRNAPPNAPSPASAESAHDACTPGRAPEVHHA